MIPSQKPGALQTPGGRLIFIITLLLVVMMAARTPLDSDLWWHLRSGQVTIETGRPLLTDVFSYTRAGMSWINHSWLSQVFLYELFHLAGYAGLSLWVTSLAVASLVLIFFQMQGPASWRALLIILGAVVLAPVWSPRPQLASLALFALLAWMLERWKNGKLHILWPLPLLFIIWSNLHGGYSLGFLLIGAFVGGQILSHGLGLHDDAITWRKLGSLVFWSGLAFLAVAINPNGINMWRIPFQTVGVESLQQFIQEWASPDFHDTTQQPAILLIALLIGSVGLSGRKLSPADWLTSAGFLALGLISRRNLAPFALVSLPIISRHGLAIFQDWQEQVRPGGRLAFLQRNSPNSRPHPWLNLLLAGLIGFAAFAKLGVVTLPGLVQPAEAGLFPQAAVKWMKDNPSSSRTLSEYAWGGYLIWNLPDDKVFMDGRTDLFGDEIITQWRQVVQGEEKMLEILDFWQVQQVALLPNRPAVNALEELGWMVAYQDSTCVILRRGGY